MEKAGGIQEWFEGWVGEFAEQGCVSQLKHRQQRWEWEEHTEDLTKKEWR